MNRPYNFSAGPAAMPTEVLQQAATEMLDWHGSGMGVMEMSHRGKEFMSIAAQAEADLRELLAVPANFRILFMQGGGLAENAIVPMNLSRGGVVDVVVTGSMLAMFEPDASLPQRAEVARLRRSGELVLQLADAGGDGPHARATTEVCLALLKPPNKS